jgi:hypothetical protein
MEDKTVYRILARKPDRRDQLGELDIDGRILHTMDLRLTQCEGMNWIHLALDRVQLRLL